MRSTECTPAGSATPNSHDATVVDLTRRWAGEGMGLHQDLVQLSAALALQHALGEMIEIGTTTVTTSCDVDPHVGHPTLRSTAPTTTQGPGTGVRQAQTVRREGGRREILGPNTSALAPPSTIDHRKFEPSQPSEAGPRSHVRVRSGAWARSFQVAPAGGRVASSVSVDDAPLCQPDSRRCPARPAGAAPAPR
jgi:hypothetical protein